MTKTIPRAVLIQLTKSHGTLCQNCKSIEFEEIHHIDRNHSNNVFSNLELLCLKCHNDKHRELRENNNNIIPETYTVDGQLCHRMEFVAKISKMGDKDRVIRVPRDKIKELSVMEGKVIRVVVDDEI